MTFFLHTLKTRTAVSEQVGDPRHSVYREQAILELCISSVSLNRELSKTDVKCG